MVHISEVAATFVNDIKDFLQEGQEVKVKVINIDQTGRINLSIKKAQPRSRARSGQGAAGPPAALPAAFRRAARPRAAGAPGSGYHEL